MAGQNGSFLLVINVYVMINEALIGCWRHYGVINMFWPWASLTSAICRKSTSQKSPLSCRAPPPPRSETCPRGSPRTRPDTTSSCTNTPTKGITWSLQVRHLDREKGILHYLSLAKFTWRPNSCPSNVCFKQNKVNWIRSITSLHELGREGYILLPAELKYQQPFARIKDYTFKWDSIVITLVLFYTTYLYYCHSVVRGCFKYRGICMMLVRETWWQLFATKAIFRTTVVIVLHMMKKCEPLLLVCLQCLFTRCRATSAVSASACCTPAARTLW